MNIWFTSDTHFGHTNIVGKKVSKWGSGYRDFETLREMDDALIEGINRRVKKDDIIYHLGDWSFGGIHNMYHFRKSLICENINLILGNHDQNIIDKEVKFHETTFNPYKLFSSVNQTLFIKHGKNEFFLSHYPHLSWHHAHKGSIMLHGHVHSKLNHLNENTLRMDVGVDSAKILLGEYRPFSIEEIIDLNTRKKLVNTI